MIYKAQMSIDTTLYPFNVTETMTQFRHNIFTYTKFLTPIMCQKTLGLYTTFLCEIYYGTTWTSYYKQIDCALRL